MSTPNRISELERLIKAKKAEIAKLKKKEDKARKVWNKHHHVFEKAADDLADIKIHGTRKEERIKKTIKSWRPKTITLTRARDSARVGMAKAHEELNQLSIELAVLSSQLNSRNAEVDEIIKRVFELNDSAVTASKNREAYLTRHVFNQLYDDNGNQRTQVTFTSSDGLRRVTAMVNSITIVDDTAASTAKTLIEQFFERYDKPVALSPSIKPLFDLTRQLLTEKTKFKVGPHLYRFLTMELDSATFPELHEAQRLLRSSIRSEKTNSYIRIKKRTSLRDKWQQVPQS